MKHINLSSWKLSLTDWTNLNYVKGGLADEYADIANVKGNYIKKSENLLILNNIAETTANGITFSVSNGIIKVNGTCNSGFSILIDINELHLDGIYYLNDFNTNVINNAYWYLMNDGSQVKSGNIGRANLSLTFTNNKINRYRIYINSGCVFNNLSFKPMLISGTTAPTEYQPGSTSGLYIEDNVNDELIPINNQELLRMNINIVNDNPDEDMR